MCNLIKVFHVTPHTELKKQKIASLKKLWRTENFTNSCLTLLFNILALKMNDYFLILLVTNYPLPYRYISCMILLYAQ